MSVDSKTYSPEQALITYRKNNQVGPDDFYVEIHDVLDTSTGLVLGAGKPVTYDTARRMAIALNEKYVERYRFKGLIPTNILYADISDGHQTIVWHTPAEERDLYFAKRLKIKNGKGHCPPMLFVLRGKELSAYALKTNKRPDGNTILYRAPFHNVNNNCHVCMGSAKVREPQENIYEDLVRNWEYAFWNSEFSEIHGSPIKGKTDLTTFWKEHMKSGKPFPKQKLIKQCRLIDALRRG